MALRCQPAHIPARIFRAYDIRGVVDEQLIPDVAHDIAKAYAAEVLASGSKTVVVGYDARLSGPALMTAFQEGLLSSSKQSTAGYLGIISSAKVNQNSFDYLTTDGFKRTWPKPGD